MIPFAAVSAGVGLLGGFAQTLAGARQKRQAKQAAENFRRQDLRNFARETSLATTGARFQQEEQARTTGDALEALRSGGTRALGSVGRVVSANNNQNRVISADLDRQRMAREQAIAQEESNLQDMREARERQELQALQQQMNAGNQQMWQGIGGMANSLGAGLSSMGAGAGVNPGQAQAQRQVAQLQQSPGFVNPIPSGAFGANPAMLPQPQLPVFPAQFPLPMIPNPYNPQG